MASGDLINVNGDWNEVSSELFAKFCDTFDAIPPIKLCGKKIVYDSRQEDGFCEGFWHVVSRGKGENRLFDPRRAERLGWIKEILLGHRGPLTCFKYLEGSGQTKVYLWLEHDDYVVIFSEKKHVMVLVTAFFIDVEFARRDLQKRKRKGQVFGI